MPLLKLTHWEKIMRYYTEHQHNPDKYPEWRNTHEWSAFVKYLRAFISAFFTDKDSILGKMFLFFLDNPILNFILGVAFAFFAFNLVRSALRTARV